MIKTGTFWCKQCLHVDIQQGSVATAASLLWCRGAVRCGQRRGKADEGSGVEIVGARTKQTSEAVATTSAGKEETQRQRQRRWMRTTKFEI